MIYEEIRLTACGTGLPAARHKQDEHMKKYNLEDQDWRPEMFEMIEKIRKIDLSTYNQEA